MAITRWDPFGEMLGMQREMDRLMSRLGGIRLVEEVPSMAWMPRTDVKREGTDLVLHMDVPGVKPEDVNVEVTDGILTIRGERKQEEKHENEDYILRERATGMFERSMVLPEGVDPNSIKADFHDGTLEVHIPKAAEMQKPQTTQIPLGQGAQRSMGQGTQGTQGAMGTGQQGTMGQQSYQTQPQGQQGTTGQQGQQGSQGQQGTMGQQVPEGQRVPESQRTPQGSGGQGYQR